MPLEYSLDLLAQRWSTDPERLDEMSGRTVLRGLTFMHLEAQAATRQRRSDG